ncbi:MAG: hypothetical protein ACE5I3_12115 [Phycisphaerae bacterium]
MKPTTADRQVSRRIDRRLCLGLLFMLVIARAGQGVPPIEPLPPPEYSFDLASYAVYWGTVDAGDVLSLAFPDPDVLLPRVSLGLASSLDDLDALSAANASVDPNETFVLLFSVSSETVGVAPPDPVLIALHVPFNAADQALRGHAAGDQFMSTQLFTRLGGQSGVILNNVLVRNNYDEGGTDFSALPETSAYEPATDDLLDIVNATGWLTREGEEVVNVYFSLTADSPSLPELSHYGFPSGADIFFNEQPLAWTPTDLYATHDQLQLVQDDDIDALIVLDTNDNRHFDEPDQILFSLTPDSPSLATIPGASQEGAAADVFMVAPGEMPTVLAAAADLGLGDQQDDIDALDFVFCDDALDGAARHGIRLLRGDLDGDGDVDLSDLSILLSNYSATSGMVYEDGDLDNDGDVDLSDLAQLLANYGDTYP